MTWNDHDHRGEYAEERHWHHDLEHADETAQQEIRGLREDVRDLRSQLDGALERIGALEKQSPQARQLQYEADLAMADLAESGYRDDEYRPPVRAGRHGLGCQCPYCYEEPEDDQGVIPEPQTGVAAMQRFLREHPLGAPRQVHRTYWPNAMCEFVGDGMCGEPAVVRVSSRAIPSEHLWCCGPHRDQMLRVSPDDAYVSWAKPDLPAPAPAAECAGDEEDHADEPEEEPPVAEHDPGPEIDDRGGMSEYRYTLPEDYQRGQS
jgi:hypothetical protein